MKGESYYETVAQVLPTLLIAVVIELVALFRESYLIQKRIAALLSDRALAARWDERRRYKRKGYRYTLAAYFVVAAFFFFGEVSAVAVLYVGSEGGFLAFAGPLSALALIGMCLMAVFAPLLNSGAQLDWQAFEDDIRGSM